MKHLLLTLAFIASLASCKEQEQPWCEQDNSADVTVVNNDTAKVRVTFLFPSGSTGQNVFLKGGESGTAKEVTSGDYRVLVYKIYQKTTDTGTITVRACQPGTFIYPW